MRNHRSIKTSGLKRQILKASGDGPVDKRWYLFNVVLLVAGILLHQPLLIVIAVLLLLVLGITDIWALYCLDNLRYQRQFSEQRVLFGEEVTLSISIENAKLLPLPWLEVEDTLPRALTIKGQKLQSGMRTDLVSLECLFSARWYERVTRRYTVQCNARGVHTFGPTKLRSSDIFGFVSRERELSNREYLLVYPLVAPIQSFGLPAHHPFGDRRMPRRLLEDPTRVIGVRDYAYGDSLRRVNWKATARTMKMQSHVYQSTTTHTLVLFLNIVSQLDIYYGIRPDLQELSICATASVADWALNEGYAVGLYTNTLTFMPDEDMPKKEINATHKKDTMQTLLQRRSIRLPAASNEEQRKRIMDILARVQSFFGSSIEDVLQTERTHLPVGATVVIITSTIGEQLIDTLDRMHKSGHAVAILFVGDAPPPIKLAGVTIHYLGGEINWKMLMNAYSRRSDDTENSIQATPGFRL
jgi:uncharacterized protein (DUF58 family)